MIASISKLRPRFRFGLRTLLVATAVLAIGSFFAARHYKEWKRRERARIQRAQLLEMRDFPDPQRFPRTFETDPIRSR